MIDLIKFPEKPSECPSSEAFGGELGWIVYYKLIGTTWMSWFLLEINRKTEGETMPELQCADDTGDGTTDPDAGVLFACGSIKWDGCTDFTVGDPRVSAHRHHVCGGPVGMQKIADMLLSIPALAKRVMPAWDGDD